MATDTDLVASKAAALRLAKRMGCTGAHQHPDGKWMPCSTMEEYEKLKKTQPDSEKSGIEIIESRRRYRNSKGRNKRNGWEKLGERGLTSIDTISGGGLVGGRSGSIKAAGGWAPNDEDPDVFTSPRGARRRARQLGCIGIARRTSRSGKTVWTPCSNMTDYAKRTGSTAFGRHHQRRQARRTLERAVAREVRRQLRRKKSLMETLYEGKALGRKLRAARIATTTPFDPDARDADMDMLVQEGTPWERPARPRIPQIGTNRAGRRRAERGADRRERRRDLSQPQRSRSRQETARTAAREWRRMMTGKPPTTDDENGFASQRYEFGKRFPGFASERPESVEELRKEILDRVGEAHRNKDHREVHFVFGPPGSGKTARVDDGTLHVPGKGEAAHTDPDIYKPYDRAWNDGEGADVAHGPSRWESKKTIREAEKLGMDVVVQGTGKDGQLLSELVYIDGNFEKGRQENVTSIMHFVWSSDRDRRIFDRGVGRGPDDQRRRFGTDPRDEAEIRNRITKYIEEGRLDEFYIYDNDVDPDRDPPVIASFLDGVLVVHDEEKFDKIFTETDTDGNPVPLTPGGYVSPGVYALSDDPRVGKTHAQRIRDFGDDPEAYRKYDEKKRKDIADRMRAFDRGEDPDAEEGHASQRSLGNEYRRAQKARGWASRRGESFEDRYGETSRSGEGDCYLASVKAGRELEEAGVDNFGNPVSNIRIVHGTPTGQAGGESEGTPFAHAWIEYDVEAPEPVFHRDLLDPETQKQILERIPDDMREQFMELIKVSLEMEKRIKAGESNLFDTLGTTRPGKRTMVRDWSNIRKSNDSEELEPYFEIDRAELVAGRPDFDRDWYYEQGKMTDDDVMGEFSLDEMELLQKEFGVQDYGRDQADEFLEMLHWEDPGTTEARRRAVAESNEQVRSDLGYASSREELKSEDGPLAKMFPDSTERERGYLAYQLLANGAGGEDDRVPQELWDTFVRLVEQEHPGVMERLEAVPKTLETVDGYERLTQSGLISAPGIVNGIDPGQIGEPVTLYHAGYVDLRQADGTFAGKARQQFGPGVYTASEAFPVIYGWARPKQGTDGIQTGQPGYLHTTKWTGDGSPRILDMEEPLPDDLLDLTLDHLFDLNRFIEAADPVKERPSTPEEYESFGQDMDWTFDEYRIHLKDELVARINNTIERIRRSQEQGRPQRTGREILGPNGGLADIFREIDITPDGIIDLTGNPDGWVKPAVVDRMRTKLNNDLVEAGYDVLRAIDVRREEFMFLDPSKVEFVDSAKISSVDPFGTDGGHHLRQILYEESGYASTRGGRMTDPLIVDRGYAIHHADMRFGEERSISILPENRTYNQTLTNPDLYQYEVGTVKKVGSRRDQYEVTLNDGTKFRRSKLREVYEELERLKPQPNDRKPEEIEGVGPVRTGRNRELVRDIELPGGNTVEVDASLAPRVKRMNDAGYLTAAAGSGNPEDYPPPREAGSGYIGFYKSQLNDEKIDDLRRAAAEAGLSFEEQDLYFQPGVTVRTAVMADGTSYFGSGGIHEQSSALAAEELGVEWPDTSAIVRGLRPPMTPEENADFYRLLDKRDKEITPRLEAEHGGRISPEEGQRRWAKFEDALLGESGHASAREPNSAGRGRPQYDADGSTIPRIFDANAAYTYEDLEEWDMLELREAARSLGVPFTKKRKKELVEDILARRTDRKRTVHGVSPRNEEPSHLQQMDMLRNQYRNAETVGDQDEMDRIENELRALGSRVTRRRNRPSGHASSRQPPSPEEVVFRTEKFLGEHNLATPEPSGSQWVQTPDGGYARFSTRPEGEGTGDVFVEPLSGWHSPRQYVFVTEEVAHDAQASGVPPRDEDVSLVPKAGLHALSLGPTPERTHVSDRIVEVPKRRPVIPMRGFASARDDSDEYRWRADLEAIGVHKVEGGWMTTSTRDGEPWESGVHPTIAEARAERREMLRGQIPPRGGRQPRPDAQRAQDRAMDPEGYQVENIGEEAIRALSGNPDEIRKNLKEIIRDQAAGDARISMTYLDVMTDDLLGDMDTPDDPWHMEAEGGAPPWWADAKTPPPEPPRVVQGYRDRLDDLKEIFDSWETPNQAALAMIDYLMAVLDDHDRRYKSRG